MITRLYRLLPILPPSLLTCKYASKLSQHKGLKHLRETDWVDFTDTQLQNAYLLRSVGEITGSKAIRENGEIMCVTMLHRPWFTNAQNYEAQGPWQCRTVSAYLYKGSYYVEYSGRERKFKDF